jgi:sugar/nucleoside kinase (ribokinase family)
LLVISSLPLNGPIAFRYTTPKLRLDHDSLDRKLLSSKSFHLICGPARCVELVTGIMRNREQLGMSTMNDTRPLFVWEPVPDLCQPSELQACFEALEYVDIVSPNHAELCGFFSEEPHDDNGNIASHTIEKCCKALLAANEGETKHLKAVIIRAGKDGCVVATTTTTVWLPAYHQQASRVVDATGGGNTFLGGFTVSLARAGMFGFKDIRKAVIDGAVSASFAIEQVGMPKLTVHGDMTESWNDDSVQLRVAELAQRTPDL